MGRVAVFIFWFFTASVAYSQPLSEVIFTVEGCVVAPGGIGQVRLRWSGLSSREDVRLTLDAPAPFTFLNLPSAGDQTQGEAMALFMVHPFTAAGTHTLQFELVQGIATIANAFAEVEVEPRYSVESTIITEGRDTIKVLHMNTGNIAVFVEGEQLIPGATATLNHIREDEYALTITAQSQEWDTSYSIALNERFYPHETARPKAATKPLLTIAAQRQWAQSGGFGMWNARLHKKNWQINLSQWNSNFRGSASYEDGRTKIQMGNANARVIEQMRPKNGLYTLGSLNSNRTDFYFDRESALLRYRYKRDWGAIAPGGIYFDNRILPVLKTRLEGKTGQLDWEAVGKLQDMRWEVGNRTLKTYGRVLYVPQNFQRRTIQQTSGLVGTSAIVGSVRWSHQSSIFGPRTGQHFHNAQLQWGRGHLQWNARTQLNGRTGLAFLNLHSTYTHGAHSLSGRFQQQAGKATQQNGWTGVYRWRGPHQTFGFSAQHLSNGWNLRAQGSAALGGYRISGQWAYTSLFSNQWFYQTTLSKSIHNHNITLSSSRRIPLRIGWNANLFPERSHATLKGRIEGMDGKAIQGAMITCQGRTIQSNSEGNFTFQHLTGTEATIEIHPESLPFAKFPSAGYSQTILLTKASQNIIIQCFTTSAIQGSIDISFLSEPALRPSIDWNTVSIQLIGSNDSLHECRVNALGHYHMSNLKSGVYELHIRGLGKYFTALPIAVEIVEEQILEQPLVIQEIPNQIPFQEL